MPSIRYLYVDTDNIPLHAGVSENPPTADDLGHLEVGMLRVFRIGHNTIEALGRDGQWHLVSPAEFYVGDGEVRHAMDRVEPDPEQE